MVEIMNIFTVLRGNEAEVQRRAEDLGCGHVDGVRLYRVHSRQ